MRLLWVSADKPLSRLIRWGLDSDCSHFALVFDEDTDGSGIVFHSYGAKGVQVEWFSEFLKRYTIKHALEPIKKLTLEEEEKVYKKIISNRIGKAYDKAAFAWFAYRAVLAKTKIRKMPAYNAWNNEDQFLCVEVLGDLLDALEILLPKIDLAMTPPHELYTVCRECRHFRPSSIWVERLYANLPPK